jgi:hypothetical protein
MDPIELNVVFYEDGDLWVAQAIEFDIAARADKPSKLPRAFERAVMANLVANQELGRQRLEGIPAAPQRFRELFESAHFNLREHRAAAGNQNRRLSPRRSNIAFAAAPASQCFGK